MAGAGALDESPGSSRQQFRSGIRTIFDFRVKRPDGTFMQTIEQCVITHYIQILVGNRLRFNAKKTPGSEQTSMVSGRLSRSDGG
jgi:hypothetical protein